MANTTNPLCDLTNPNFNYFYCPSYAAAILFSVLFGITTIGHIFQAIWYRKPFATVLIMGGLWEVAGYGIRTISTRHPYTTAFFTPQLLLILLAPLWINAFMYMLIGRTIHFFLDHDRIFRVRARKITLVFVIFDITAFLVQGTGGSITGTDDASLNAIGIHIYTGGVGLQIFFNLIFLAIVVRFQKTAIPMLQEVPATTPTIRRLHDCRYLLRSVYSVFTLIMIRNIYRLIEFEAGPRNALITHEWFAYLFDGVLMLMAMVVFNLFHPGRKLQGPRCDFREENRALKHARKDRKAAKKQQKRDRAAAKRQRKIDEKAVKKTQKKRKDHGVGDLMRGPHDNYEMLDQA